MAENNERPASYAAVARAIANLKYYADQNKAAKSHTHNDTDVNMSNGKTLKEMLTDGSLQGTSAYVHIRWKSSETSTTLLTIPDKYIGIVSSNSAVAPTSVSGYTWYKYKGEDGVVGTKIFVSADSPTVGLASIGDLWFNTSTGQFFEQTAGNAWVAKSSTIKGSAIITGTGAPAAGIGNSHSKDLYIDTTPTGNYDFYQKGTNGWNKKGSLKGADGVIGKDGEPGSQILNSATNPATSLGRVGDWCINTDTFDIFEKTAESAWSKRGNLRGKDNIGGGIIYDGRVIVAPIFATMDENGAMSFDPDGEYLLSQDIDGNIIFREYFRRMSDTEAGTTTT